MTIACAARFYINILKSYVYQVANVLIHFLISFLFFVRVTILCHFSERKDYAIFLAHLLSYFDPIVFCFYIRSAAMVSVSTCQYTDLINSP